MVSVIHTWCGPTGAEESESVIPACPFRVQLLSVAAVEANEWLAVDSLPRSLQRRPICQLALYLHDRRGAEFLAEVDCPGARRGAHGAHPGRPFPVICGRTVRVDQGTKWPPTQSPMRPKWFDGRPEVFKRRRLATKFLVLSRQKRLHFMNSEPCGRVPPDETLTKT